MARNGRKRKAKALVDAAARFLRPTDERMAHNDVESAGAAYRITPVIDTLYAAGKLSEAHYSALSYYRDQAHRAEDDCAQEGSLAPAKIMGGGGCAITGGQIPAGLRFTPAIAETGRIERDLGALLDIARAIAVDDMTLTRWCIQQHGGRERHDGKGRVVAMVPLNPGKVSVIELALTELRYAAGKIVR